MVRMTSKEYAKRNEQRQKESFKKVRASHVKKRVPDDVKKIIASSRKSKKLDNSLALITFETELKKIDDTFVKEYEFADDRKFRFDYCFLHQKLAIEVEGGIWINGRHTRGEGYQNDMIKYNLATELGFTILRYSYEMLLMQETFIQIKNVLNKQ